jgi:hypothetical protein
VVRVLEEGDLAVGGDAADAIGAVVGEPQVSVGSGGDAVGFGDLRILEGRELAAGGDAAEQARRRSTVRVELVAGEPESSTRVASPSASASALPAALSALSSSSLRSKYWSWRT